MGDQEGKLRQPLACQAQADTPAWSTFWLPPLLALSKQCINANPPIRQRAITYLQRLLLSTHLSISQSTTPIYDRVLFPIMDELLKSPDPTLAETRLRASGLLCKVFLADASRLAESQEGVVPVFTRLLSVMERMVRSEKDGMVSLIKIHVPMG
jgi:brefeldin A-resistance guanine nucleotide exchange factor 1